MTTLPRKLETSVMSTIVRPGTRYQVEVFASLNQARERRRTAEGASFPEVAATVATVAPRSAFFAGRNLQGCRHVRSDDRRAVGINSVNDEPDFPLALSGIALESRRNVDDRFDSACGEEPLGRFARSGRDRAEVGRSVDPLRDVLCLRARFPEYDRHGHVLEVHRKDVAEEKQKHERKEKAHDNHRRVPPHLAGFLPNEGDEAPKTFESTHSMLPSEAAFSAGFSAFFDFSASFARFSSTIVRNASSTVAAPAERRTSAGDPRTSTRPAS